MEVTDEQKKAYNAMFNAVPITNGVATPEQVAAYNKMFPVYSAPPTPVKVDSPVNDDVGVIGSFLGGLGEGGSNLKTMGISLGAIGADVVGADETRDNVMQTVIDREAASAERREKYTSFQEMQDAEGIWDSTESFAKWLSFATGEQVPNILAVLGGAVTGGATLAPLIGKAVAKKAISKEMAQMAGAYLASTGIETGATGSEQITDLGELSSGTAVAAGMAKGALETVTPLALGKAAGILGTSGDELFTVISKAIDESSSRLAKAGSGALRTGLMEAATEATQEAVDVAARTYVDKNYDWAGPEAKQRVLEAAVTALATGGLLGGVAGSVAQPLPKGSDEPGVVQGQDVVNLGISAKPTQVTPPGTPAGLDNIEPIAATTPEANYPEASKDTGLLDLFLVTPRENKGELPGKATFQSSTRAFYESVQDPKAADRTYHEFVQPTQEVIDTAFANDAITSPLHQLPDAIELNDDNVLLTDISQGSRAFNTAQRAVEAYNKGNERRAQSLYNQAIDAGFRYIGDFSRGFTLLDVKDKTGLFQSKGPSSPALDTSLYLNGGISNKGELIPVTGRKNIYSASMQRPSSRHHIIAYKDRLDGSKLTESSIGDILYTDLKDSGEELPVLVQRFEELKANPDYNITVPDGVSSEDVIKALRFSTAEFIDLVEKGLRYLSPDQTNRGLTYVGKLSKKDVRVVGTVAGDMNESMSGRARAGVDIGTLHEKSLKKYAGSNPLVVKETGKPVDAAEVTKLHATGPGLKIVTGALEVRLQKNKRVLEALYKSAEKLQKLFLKDVSLILYIYDRTNSPYGYRDTPSSDGKQQVIGINLKGKEHDGSMLGILNPRKDRLLTLLTTYVHELGHAMSVRYLYDEKALQSGLTAEVLNAYHHAQQRATLLNASTTNPEMYGYIRGLQVYRDSLNGTDFKNVPLVRQKGVDTEYNLRFEEWIAEQTVLYLQSGQSPLTATDKFFSWFARRATQLYNAFYRMTGVKQERKATIAFENLIQYITEKDSTQDAEFINSTNATIQKDRKFNKRLGVSLARNDASQTKRLKEELLRVLPKAELDQITESGHTLKSDMETMADARDYFTSIVKWGWNVLQLAWKNPHVRHLQEYVNKADLWQKEKNEWQSLANETIRQWKGLGKERSDKLAKLLFDLDKMDKHPTVEELQKLVDQYKIDEATMVVFRKVTQDFQSMLDRLEEIAISQLAKNVDPIGPLFIIEKAKIVKEFKQLREKPYFPHARFGDWAVVVSDEKGKTVYMEQIEVGLSGGIANMRGKTPKAAMKLLADVKKDLEPGQTAAVTRIPEAAQPYQGMPPAVIMRIRQQLDSSLNDEQKAWLENLAVEYAPTQSFRKRLIKRKNTPGYSQDAMRAYANYFWHGSNHLARISYGSDMQDIIVAFRKDISAKMKQGLDVANRVKMADFLDDHLKSILDPKPDWAQLRSMAFTWWLGFSPASAVLNFTQLPLVTAPYLSARYGDLKTMSAMRSAAFNLRKMYLNPEEMAKKWNPADAKLLELGLQQGFLEESLAMELAGVAEGSNLVRAKYGSATERGMAGFAHAAGWMFQGSEKINRRITFNSAVQLARANPDASYLSELRHTMSGEYDQLTRVEGLSKIEATAFLAGKDAVRRTQFEYGAWAKPRFMRGRKGVIFTFYMFLQNMVWAVGNSPGNKRILFNLLLAGGLMGLPGADDMEEVVEFFGRKLFGERWKASEEFSKFVVHATGSARTADLLLHGAGREGFGLPAMGDMLGIPIPQFDMSANVGMGNIVPGLAEALNNDRGSFEETLGNMTTDIAGASFGIGINMVKFLGDTQLPIDDMKRWERAMPRAFKNVVRGMRYLPPDSSIAAMTGNFVEPEGRERSRTGSTIVAFEGDNPEHMMEIAMQTAGFSPTRITREWNEVIAKSEVISYWTLRKQMLMNQFWHTLYTKDTEARSDVLAAIKNYNRTVPYSEMGIRGKNLAQSVKQRQKAMLRKEHGIEDQKSYRRLSQETGIYYPNKDELEDNVVSREVVK